MKKFILSAVAAGALAFGGAASAQDLGGVLSTIIGQLGFQTQPYGYGTYGYGNVLPGVVAQPYGSTVYVDQYGRQVYVDQYGRQVLVQPQTDIYAYSGRTWDRDGDGIANRRDRWPDDSRYF